MEAASSEPWEGSFDDDDEGLMDVPAEIDGALLMELLEEQRDEEADDDDDRLGAVILSLETSISAAGQAAKAACSSGDMVLESVLHRHEECEDCRLDDILSGLESHDYSTSSTYLVEEPFGWVEMEAAVESPRSDMVDWYVDGCIDEQLGVVGYGEPAVGHPTLYHTEETKSVDQYISLWE